MRIPISNVTCNDEKAYNRCINYLYQISEYKNFDDTMMMNVYVDDNNDMIGFESVNYRIQFVNNAHKLKEILLSPVSVDPVPFNVLRSHILAIGAT